MRNGRQSTVTSDHQNFEKILKALKNQEYDKLETLMSTAKTIAAYGTYKHGRIFAENGKVFFEDTRNRKTSELHGSLVDRILRSIGTAGCEKFAMALMNLLENIKKNPIKDISDELYEWFLSGKNPITLDGCILAYKKVRRDYTDHYTGTMDNSPGQRVWQKQDTVDTNRANTCSRGLHFASLRYLSHYAGSESNSRVVIVKVNPRHIFAIPRDYNCQKGRASEYLVVGEYDKTNRESVEAFTESFIDEDNAITGAPDVKFIKNGLRPSLETMAENIGLVKNGKVKMGTDGKPIEWDDDAGRDYVIRSFETKAVRAAVKAAVAASK
jgi:hypothetical protein